MQLISALVASDDANLRSVGEPLARHSLSVADLRNARAIDSVEFAVQRVFDLARDHLNASTVAADIKEQLARWLDDSPWFMGQDFATSRLFTDKAEPFALFLGTLDDGRAIHLAGESSLVTIAPPGAGKTRGFVLPNLLNFKGSVFVLDVKGECYSATAATRATFSNVYLFAPEQPDEMGDRYNPLDFISRDTVRLIEEARCLADAGAVHPARVCVLARIGFEVALCCPQHRLTSDWSKTG